MNTIRKLLTDFATRDFTIPFNRPTANQYMRLEWLLAMVLSAAGDREHPFWATVDDLWKQGVSGDVIGDAVRSCLILMGNEQTALRSIQITDPKFERISAARFLALPKPNSKRGYGARGPSWTLATIALECGALGCEQVDSPTDKQIKIVVNRWKKYSPGKTS